jgi:hypothetical protein
MGMKPVRFEFSSLATMGKERKVSRPPISQVSLLVIVCCQRLSVQVRVTLYMIAFLSALSAEAAGRIESKLLE